MLQMLQDLESITILHYHLYVLTLMLMVMNFHNLLDWLQDIKSRSSFPPHPTLHLCSASHSKTGQKTAWHKCRNCYFLVRKMFLSSPFGKWRTRKDWKAWKGKNEGRFLRALLRWRVQGVSKDKVCTDSEKKTLKLIQACIRPFSAAGPDDKKS